jgi:phage shock protein C
MDCTHCARQIEADSTFCRYCGARTVPVVDGAASTATAADPPHRLFRRSSEGRIAGVCAGIAEYLNADVTVVRLLWVILSIVPGGCIGGIVVYIAAWMIVPDAPAGTVRVVPSFHTKRLTRSLVDRKVGGVCGGLANYLNVDPTLVRVVWIILTIVPGAIVFGVAAYLVVWFVMPDGDYQVMTATPSAA